MKTTVKPANALQRIVLSRILHREICTIGAMQRALSVCFSQIDTVTPLRNAMAVEPVRELLQIIGFTLG